MRYPWANTTLLILLAIQLATGAGSLLAGSAGVAWVIWLHGLVAYGLVILLSWKAAIVVSAFRRRPSLTFSRLAFLLLTALLLLVLASGFLWSHGGPRYLGGFSLLTLHGFLAVTLIGLLVWHILARRFVFRIPAARNRRAFLRLGGISLGGLILWRIDRPIQAALGWPGTARRFTGSYEIGSFTGIFPQVSWLFDFPQPIDREAWRLAVEGAVAQPLTFTYAELASMANTSLEATLDCTGGWYTHQEWRGIPLAGPLDRAGLQPTARSVTVEAVSGYRRRFSLEEARTCLLATHVAGQPLSHGHGAPLRLVVPDQRGFAWVKWVARIQVNETSAYWQSPLPLQ